MPDTPPPPPAPGRRPPSPLGTPAPPAAPARAVVQRATEAVTAPEGFVPQPGKEKTHITPVQDVYVHFTPRHANRESTVLLFKRGVPVTPDEYQRSMDRYAEQGRMEYK